MDPIFKKMNFKSQSQVVVINTPASFEANIKAMEGLTNFKRSLEEAAQIEFVVAFVTQQAELNTLVPAIAQKLEGDALVWCCYPKGTSKNYTCDFNRDTGWAIMGAHGLEGVRMVAIDKDWSALRFRKVEFIKKLTRRKSMTLTKEGSARTTGKG